MKPDELLRRIVRKIRRILRRRKYLAVLAGICVLFILVIALVIAGAVRKRRQPEEDVMVPGITERIPESSLQEIIASEAPIDPGRETYTYLDQAGNLFTAALDTEAIACAYDQSGFYRDGGLFYYEDANYTCEQGIDVSSYCGEIDWTKVRNDGIKFAFIRIGYRGYTEGGIFIDSMFDSYIRGAASNGIETGVYFFSQATSEGEAIEEADFVIDQLKRYHITLPVVFDEENVGEPDARTNTITDTQFTKNAKAFCERIKDAGYQPAVYCNEFWQAYRLDMSEFNDTLIWLADFRDYPQSPYHYEYWQYTYKGKVDGIPEDVTVDRNIRFIKK